MEPDRNLRKEEIIEYLNSQKRRFREEYHIRKIALIGSFARNEQNPESDVDIIVDIEEGTPEIFEMKRSLKKELEETFGRTVEIASERYLKPFYRTEILQEAVYVYEK
ncbi:MAG: nucleotidyltransferase domain-containing protein [Spirochaetales bacterium]|nr:nucleotidyltransferase domain-containing protein [Spirochaetales bacterium]